MMEKWEYCIKSFLVLDNLDKLNEMGALGWELVMKKNFTVIFKRKVI
jgi:hypothetical protein